MINEVEKNKISMLVKQIEEENVVNGEVVGFCGEKTEQYIRFEELLSIASTEEFLELSKHKNGVVRCYAIWALSKMKYDNLYEIVKDHLEDIEAVETFFGCHLGIKTVIDFCITFCDLTKKGKVKINQTFQLNSDIKIKAGENIEKLAERLKSKYFSND